MKSSSRSIDLQEKDLLIVQQIVDTYLPDRSVYVFGSRATGRARRCSDLDLAVDGAPLTLREEAVLDYAFEESDLSITVDVINLSQATGVFRKRIDQELTPLPRSSGSQTPSQQEQVAA